MLIFQAKKDDVYSILFCNICFMLLILYTRWHCWLITQAVYRLKVIEKLYYSSNLNTKAKHQI